MSTTPSSNLPPTKQEVNRRGFLALMIGLFSFLWGILTMYPLYRYLRPPKRAGAASNVSSVTVGEAKELPAGTGRNFQFGSVPAVLVHTDDDQWKAYNAICTHLGCTVQFREDMDRIWCACHGGQYDPATGKVLAGPPPKPLQELKAEVKDGKIVVSKA